MSYRKKDISSFYTYHHVDGLAKATRCQIVSVNREESKITIYLPLYDIEETITADIDHLDLYGVFYYPDSRNNNHRRKVRELHGHKKQATITGLIYGDIYTYIQFNVDGEEEKIIDGFKINHQGNCIPVNYLKGFSEDCPYLERPNDDIKISDDLIGRRIAIDYNEKNEPIHCLLLTDELQQLLA